MRVEEQERIAVTTEGKAITEPLTGRVAALGKRLPIAIWAVITVYLALVIGFAWNTSPFAQLLAAAGIAAAFTHASVAYGLKPALILFLICSGITFALENLGATTGFPFGRYHFEVAPNLPHVGAIPVIVGPLWFGMGYFSWVVAGILLDGADHSVAERFNFFALPAVAALVMTQWDLVMDAPGATIAKAWIWHDGGAFFGVPASNYFGWVLTSWLFYQCFALYLRRQPGALRRAASQGWAFRGVPILFYLSSGLAHITPWLLAQKGDAADGSGYAWRIENVREAAVIAMVCTMGFTALLALLRLFKLRRPLVPAASRSD
jgi:uncharacterized membrane protein